MTGRALLAMLATPVVLAMATPPTRATAAPAGAPVVFTNTDEVRACLPLAGGDALVGTAGGLVRVDAAGIARQVFTASDGLPGTRIDALVADGDRVWVGSDGGVAEYDGGIAHAVASRPVRDIARWHGAVYMATWDGGVIELGGGAVAMRGGAAAARMRVSALAVAGGTLWAGGAAGLYQMRSGRFERVEGPRDVTALAGDGAVLWIGASDGVWRRDRDGVRAIGAGEVRHLALVDNAIVAAGADGLVSVDRGRVIALPGAPRGFAQAIGAAHGAACTGGLDGLWTRRAGGWHHAPKASGPPSSDISAIVADGARLWVGTFDQGLASYEPDRGWRRIAGTDSRINALVLEPRPDGARLWVATAEGIQVIDATGQTVLRLGRGDGLPSRSVLSIARLADGRIVAGTSVGAAFVGGGNSSGGGRGGNGGGGNGGDSGRGNGRDARGSVRRVGPRGLGDHPIGNVWAIAETSAGLWLGTTTGLYRGPATPWTSKDGSDDDGALAERWQRMSVATGELRDDWVTALATRGDVLWAGTYNGGVSRIDGSTATALGGGWINPSGLVWDGDRLLAATMEGLVTGDGRGPVWRATPGLPGRDVTGAVRIDHTLWVATRRGLIAL